MNKYIGRKVILHCFFYELKNKRNKRNKHKKFDAEETQLSFKYTVPSFLFFYFFILSQLWIQNI